MQPYAKCLVVEKMLQELKRSSAGASLLWAIAALVVVGGLGAAVAVMSPSTVQSKLEQEAAMRAYYAATAGLQYVVALENGVFNNINDFSSTINSGSPYSLTSNTLFNVHVSNVNVADGSYSLDYSIGSIVLNNKDMENYSIKPTLRRVFTQKSGGYAEILKNTYGSDANYVLTNDTYTTSGVYASSVTLNDRAYVEKNVISKTSVTLSNDSMVAGYVCGGSSQAYGASSSVRLNDRASVSGDIYSDGSVTISNDAKANGQVITYGDLSMTDRAYARGDVYVGKSITMGNDSSVKFGGHVKENVSINERVKVGNGIEYGGTVNFNASPSGVKTKKVHPSSVVFPDYKTLCTIPSFPPHQKKCAAGSLDINYSGETLNASIQNSYRNISLPNDSKMTIRGGSYCINSLTTSDRTSLYFDLSGADISILFDGNVSLANDTKIYYSADGKTWILFNYGKVPDKSQTEAGKKFIEKVNSNLSAEAGPGLSKNEEYYKKLYVETLGNFSFNDRIYWFGSIYSAGNINLSNDLVLVGTFYAHNDENTAAIYNKDRVYAFYLLSNYASLHWK